MRISGERVAVAVSIRDGPTAATRPQVTATSAVAGDMPVSVPELGQQMRGFPKLFKSVFRDVSDAGGKEDAWRHSPVRHDARDQPAGTATDIFALLLLGDQKAYPAVVPHDFEPAPISLARLDPLAQDCVKFVGCQRQRAGATACWNIFGQIDRVGTEPMRELNDGASIIPVEASWREPHDDAHTAFHKPLDRRDSLRSIPEADENDHGSQRHDCRG